MSQAGKIASRVALLLVIFFACNFIYQKTFWKGDLVSNEAKVLLALTNSNDSADIIYLGESSNTTYDLKDSCKKSISELTADHFPSLVLRQVQKEATHAGNYLLLLGHLEKDSRVKTVIVTMNLRSFNASWIHSRLETSLQRSNILMRNYPPLLDRFLLSLNDYEKKSEQERELDVQKQWRKDLLQFPYPFPYKTTHQWDSAMANGGRKNTDGSWNNEQIILACHYIKAYSFQIDPDANPRVKDFDAIVSLCKEKKKLLVFNLMAENIQYADSLVGKDLVFLMKQNRDLLVKRYNKDGTIVVDNLESVCGIDYIDQTWTTEHYKQRGRIKIAKNLAEALKPFYSGQFREIKVNVEGCALPAPAADTASMRKSLADIERRIRSDTKWMKQIEAKAKERKVSTDEMIKMDAKYLYDTDPKSRIK